MRVVVKTGDAALEDKLLLQRCAQGIAELVEDGSLVAVVHGGGAALSRMLAQFGRKSEFR